MDLFHATLKLSATQSPIDVLNCVSWLSGRTFIRPLRLESIRDRNETPLDGVESAGARMGSCLLPPFFKSLISPDKWFDWLGDRNHVNE